MVAIGPLNSLLLKGKVKTQPGVGEILITPARGEVDLTMVTMKLPDHSLNAQWIHDRVLETLLASPSGFATYANLGGHQTLSLTTPGRDLTPDLALCDRETFIVRHLVEVETLESLTDAQVEKWAAEAHGPWRLWIFVPQNAMGKAAELLRQRGIPARIGSWSEDTHGVTIRWPERAPIARVR